MMFERIKENFQWAEGSLTLPFYFYPFALFENSPCLEKAPVGYPTLQSQGLVDGQKYIFLWLNYNKTIKPLIIERTRWIKKSKQKL